jgi:hypothetical protein
MRRLKILFATLTLLAAALPSVCLGDPDYFLHGYYAPAAGQVGRPFHADVAFEADDMPQNCVAEWKDMIISGVLPPGLDVAGPSSSVIAGTPAVAGNWPVTVTFRALGCTYDARYRVDRAIRVVFKIAP